MKKTYIYGIRDLEADKYIYVGKSNNPNLRYNKTGSSHNECVQAFVRLKGKKNFQVEVLEEVQFKTSEGWIEREKFWKLKLESGGHPLCNKNDGGGGSEAGWHHEEESRQKMRSGWTSEKREEQSERMRGGGNPMYGPGSEEVKAKISKANSGENNGMYGKCHTEEWKQEQSRRMSGEENPKGFLGKYHPEKWRQNHSKFLRKWHRTHETPSAKSYPAFYNEKTNEFIPSGKNLWKLCKENDLSYWNMCKVKVIPNRATRTGWRLATISEVEGEK